MIGKGGSLRTPAGNPADRPRRPARPVAFLAGPDEAFATLVREWIQDEADIVSVPLPSSSGGDRRHEAGLRTADIILMDVRQNGEEAAGMCRRLAVLAPGVPIIGLSDDNHPDRILAFYRAGGADYLLSPFSGEHRIDEALRRVLVREQSAAGELVAVTSGKGGQGVTTIALNLADRLHAVTGGNVLLVDGKLRGGDISVFLDVEDGYSLEDLRKDLPRLDGDFLFSALHRHANGFYVLFAPSDVEGAARIRAADMRRMTTALREWMDWIIMDLPLDFQETTTPVVDDADRIILVTQQTVPAVRNAAGNLRLFREIGFSGEKKVDLLINRFSPKNDISEDDVQAACEQEVFAAVHNDFISANAAARNGRLLSEDYAETAVAGDIDRLARRLAGVSPPAFRSGRTRLRDKWKSLTAKFVPKILR